MSVNRLRSLKRSEVDSWSSERSFPATSVTSPPAELSAVLQEVEEVVEEVVVARQTSRINPTAQTS